MAAAPIQAGAGWPAFTIATYVHLLPEDLPEPTFLDGITAQAPAAAQAVEAAFAEAGRG